MLHCVIKILVPNACVNKIVGQLHQWTQKPDIGTFSVSYKVLSCAMQYPSFFWILPDPDAVQWLPFRWDFQHWCASTQPQGPELESNPPLPWLSSYIYSASWGWTLPDGSRHGWEGTVLLLWDRQFLSVSGQWRAYSGPEGGWLFFGEWYGTGW